VGRSNNGRADGSLRGGLTVQEARGRIILGVSIANRSIASSVFQSVLFDGSQLRAKQFAPAL